MLEGFSFNREFDFVRLDGLRRATGRPAHEWDIYIIKELVDNALDADDVLWAKDRSSNPHVTVELEYQSIPEPRSNPLFVRVSNRAAFPVERLRDIFATQWYTSRKAFVKGLTRGALGNALKTLLGIPYALRQRVAGDWSPRQNPMSLTCGGKKYLPRYVIDSTAQTISFECKTEEVKPVEGTVTSVGLDHFQQEVPRTLADIRYIAEQYHLCNPHARFRWVVEMDGSVWEKDYDCDPAWAGKFTGTPPAEWYSPAALQDLLGALYRHSRGGGHAGTLKVEAIARKFAGYEGEGEAARSHITAVVHEYGIHELNPVTVEGPQARHLHQLLCKHSPKFDSATLGAIGEAHVRAVLGRAPGEASEVFYECARDDGLDPNVPFVIEVAAAHLREGRRQVWTAINFTPTYEDPFLNRRLFAPIRAEELVLGLRGLFDAYDIMDDVPIVLFLHLICPTVEHHEFSKTGINHLPFKQALGGVLDRLLTNLRRSREEEELRLEQAVFQALEDILNQISESERFVFDQLIEKLRARLGEDQALSEWLATPQAESRLRAYVNDYQHNHHAVLTHRVARPAAGAVSLPLHPDRHISVSTEYVSRDLFAGHHVNKLLYVQVRELEPVVIDNGWLCRMDMALLYNPLGEMGLREALVQCLTSSDLSVMALHDADEAGRGVVELMRGWLAERQLDPARVVDLGLHADGGVTAARPVKLVQMMPNELAAWLTRLFETLGIQRKCAPAPTEIRRHISEHFEMMLLAHLWEGVSQQLAFPRLVGDLDKHLQFTKAMQEQALDQRLLSELGQTLSDASYGTVLDQVVKDFFSGFMREHAAGVEELVQGHLAYAKELSRER